MLTFLIAYNNFLRFISYPFRGTMTTGQIMNSQHSPRTLVARFKKTVYSRAMISATFSAVLCLTLTSLLLARPLLRPAR